MGELDRIGIGTDLHRLGEGRRLVLGGVEIDFDKGCIGHSDGDVVLHAVTDAVLGAAGLADIGELFPDTDAKFKDADSGLLLAEAVRLAREAGWSVVNVDVVVHAERPKLSAYKAVIRKTIAGVLGIDTDSVNLKAKTGEGVGPIGAGEAISCVAVAGLKRTTGK
jgi:2-C-methyl-D-erythritol 2,4-cyclodiphosphate synthase